MPDSAFLFGTRYFQEQARRALRWIGPNTSATGLRADAAGGHVQGMHRRRVETSPLEPGSESIKFYCPGVGMVIDNDLELAAIYGKGTRRSDQIE